MMSDEVQNDSTTESSVDLATFLLQSKTSYLDAVEQGKTDEWTVVMGNEAGDLDSIASAVAYAWYRSTIQHSLAVPLTQTPRTDLSLRAENQHALSLAGIDPSGSELLCIDDIPPSKSSPFPSANFALVDHNRLASHFARDNPRARVVALIDHHADEGLYHATASPRIVAVPTGSCSSLVTRLLADTCPTAPPRALATLLLCSVLVDTNGLRSAKAEDADRAAAAFLAPHASLPLAGPALALHDAPAVRVLSEALQAKKASVAHLDTRGLLRRDYKEYALGAPGGEVRVGLASVPVGLKAMLARDDGFVEPTARWMAERGLAVLGVLTSYRTARKGKHKREQLYVVRGEEGLARALFSGLERSDELGLHDQTGKIVKNGGDFVTPFQMRAWKQGKKDATRKVTAPLVKRIIEGS